MIKLPVSNKRTDPEVERQVVTLIARGDRYADISQETGIPIPTIKKIKGRNKETLARIEDQIIRKQAESASRILRKSLNLLEQRIDSAARGEEEIKVRELVAITKEMHDQIQVEQDNRHEAPLSPKATQKRLEALTTALKDGDEVALEQIIFSQMGTNRD